MKFKKEDLQELADGNTLNDFKIMKDEIIDTSRWSVIYEMVFSFEGKFYCSSYSVGATESQDESAYEYDEDDIECTEVEPYEKTVVTYQPVQLI